MTQVRTILFAAASAFLGSGCATVVHGHERALHYTARGGMNEKTVGSGTYWHLPWNRYIKYDLRWTSHLEQIHIHSKDGLHMDIGVVTVVRPDPEQLYSIDMGAGPNFYSQIVKPAVFGACRDATGSFDHLEIATETHKVEEAIRAALITHLAGLHIQVQEVAIQNFELPPEVEVAANKKAVDNQLLAAKEIEIALASRDAEVEQTKKRGALETIGLEKKLRAEQELADAKLQQQVEIAKRAAEREKAEARAESEKINAQAEADATRIRAEAEKARIAAVSANLTPNFVRLQALDALAKAMSGNNNGRMIIMPTTKDGLPAYFGPFLNPYASTFAEPASAKTP